MKKEVKKQIIEYLQNKFKEDVLLVTPHTKKAEYIKNVDYEGNELYEVYRSYSIDKYDSYEKYERICFNELQGCMFGIASYNKFQFTLKFRFRITLEGVMYRCYAWITKSYNYIVVEEVGRV